MPGNILIITIIAIITHGWIFLSNAEIWDGWYVRDWIKNGHLDYLSQYYKEAGHPFFGWVHLHANWFPNVSFFYHLLAFGSLLGTSLGIYWILNAKNLFTPNSRFWIALFSLVYPGFLVATDSVVTLYLVCYFLCILGWCLLIASTKQSDWKRLLLRAVSLYFFFLSFFTNSILVFYYGFLLTWFFVDFGKDNLKKFIFNYWIFNIWPVVFWAWSKTFVIRAPVHQDYYRLRFDIKTVFDNFVIFFKNVLGPQIYFLVKTGILVPILFLIGYWAYKSLKDNNTKPSREFWVKLVFGAFLLACALLPYTIVNQGFGLFGWVSKNNLLVSLPIGVLMITIWTMIPKHSKFKRIVPVMLIVVCVGAQIRNYFRLEAAGAKNYFVASEISRVYRENPFAVVLLEDHLFINGTESLLAPSIWSSVVTSELYPHKPILVLTTPPKTNGTYSSHEIEKGIEDTYIPYAYKDLDQNLPQMKLLIQRGDDFQRAENVGAKYLWIKLFSQENLNDFLKKTFTVTISPLTEK